MFEVTTKAPKSKRGADRQYNAILNRYHDMFRGGGMYGWDWPTFRLNWPEGYTRCRELRAIYFSLPD